MLDIVVAGRGHDAGIAVTPGGSAAIASAWAVVEGANARVVGRIGDDLAGGALRAAVEARGVEPILSLDADRPTGTFLMLDGEIRADRGANAQLAPANLPGRIDADAVLVSGYLAPETVAAALERADADWIALSAGSLEELPPRADALLLDEDEALRLTGAAPEEAVRLLAERFRLACVTRGAGGAVAVLDGEREVAPGTPVSGHTLGAGDAFAAGLLVALARGAALDEALKAGCALGARAASSGAWPRG
jgi:sugar/nucleoside kinase (ribokinase family)